MQNQQVREIMSRDVRVIGPEAKITEAARMMDDADIGALPVCENDRLVGIITDRDIVIRSVSEGQDPNNTVVRDAMTSPIAYCYDDQETQEVAGMMRAKQVRRLVVLNRGQKLVGIVSTADFMAGGPAYETLRKAA